MNMMVGNIAAATVDAGTIHSRAMLATLTINGISGRKLDRKVTQEVNESHGASADAGRYNKIIYDPDSLKPIISLRNAARVRHYQLTLPWFHEGASILSVKAYFTYTADMGTFRDKYESAVQDWLANYDQHVERAKDKLGVMFNPADYPDRRTLEHKFSFRVAISPIPDASDFRVDISNDQAEMIRRDIEQRAQDALKLAMSDIHERISETVGRMAERLRDYVPGKKGERAQNTFKDSLVGNVRELVELLPMLNIGNDPRLTDIAARMERELCAEDADVLRDSESVRQSVAKAAESILEDIGTFLA